MKFTCVLHSSGFGENHLELDRVKVLSDGFAIIEGCLGNQ